MNQNKASTIALFLTGVVCGFLIYEWVNPTSSLGLLLSMVVASIMGFILSVIGLRRQKSALSVVALIFGALVAAVMVMMFSIMFIMGIAE